MRMVVPVLAIAVACSGSGPALTDGGGSAGGSASGYRGLGQPCTYGGSNECPAGFDCIFVNGSNGAWCSNKCDYGSAVDTCASGYDGPGSARCAFALVSGSAVAYYCGVLCAETNTSVCPPRVCDGACPAKLTCSQIQSDAEMLCN